VESSFADSSPVLVWWYKRSVVLHWMSGFIDTKQDEMLAIVLGRLPNDVHVSELRSLTADPNRNNFFPVKNKPKRELHDILLAPLGHV
jgi:hypothetical protein